MKHTAVLWAWTGSLALLAGGCGLYGGARPSAPPKTSVEANRNTGAKTGQPVSRADKKLKVLAFYDPSMSAVPPDPLALLKAHPGLVDYLAPFWYEVDPAGGIIHKPAGNVGTLAAQQHLPLVPLFNNANGNDTFLHSAAGRDAAARNIAALVKAHAYRGVNIDFQLLKATDRADLVAFMTTLKKSLPSSTLVSMSVVPLSSGNGSAGAYDFRALDRVTNIMVLMAYDLHGDGTAPGPVSPFPWVVKSVRRAINAGIQPSKLYLGIANYGYLWTGNSTRATTIPLKVMYQHKYGAYTYNPIEKEGYDHYVAGGVGHTIWFVNDRGAAARIRLAERDKLGGVAFWRVGYEDAAWWNTVARALGSGKGSPSAVKSTHAGRPATSPQHRAHTGQ